MRSTLEEALLVFAETEESIRQRSGFAAKRNPVVYAALLTTVGFSVKVLHVRARCRASIRVDRHFRKRQKL